MFPTLFMLAFLVYFLMPLWWLLVSSTKSIDDLFNSFGLWFSHFNFADNLSETFSKDGGIYWEWLRNTLVYSFVSAIGAALLAAMAGLRVREVRVPWQGAAVLDRAGRGDGPHHRARDPDCT